MKSSLSIKYTLLNVMLIMILVTAFSMFFVNQHKESYQTQIISEAKNYISILETSIAEQIKDYDFKKMRESVYFIKENPSIEYVYVLNNKGEIIADGDITSNGLYQIPNDQFQKKSMSADSLTIQQNNNLFDVSTPIVSQESKLGVIRIGYSKEDLKATTTEFINTSILLGLVIIILGIVITYLVILRISLPIKKLISLTYQIAIGNFSQKIVLSTNDEIKILADSFNDMTDKLSEVRDSLILAKEEAEKSDELKSEFLAQISHEIRTPINTMLNYSTLIEEIEFKEDSNGKEYFKVMRSASQRIIRTIDLILNISEVQKGSYNTNYVNLNICEDILQVLYKEYLPSAEKKGLEFSIHGDFANCEFEADQYTVMQIFQNLIENAIKYTNKGFVKLLVTSDKKELKITVADSGVGISKEMQKNMFEFYEDEEKIYLKKFLGSGLGILLVQNYCEINNAKLKIISEESKGTEVEVIFSIKH